MNSASVIKNWENENLTVGLALSGGGVRCYFHLGCWSVFEKKGFDLNEISGTSGGAIIGSFLAAEKSTKEITEIFEQVKWWKMVSLSFSRKGIFTFFPFIEWLAKQLPEKLENLPIRLFISCSDLHSGKALYFQEGPLPELVAASSSLPLLFCGIEHQGITLFDGGPTNNLPFQPLSAEKKIIIHSNSPFPPQPIKGMVKTMERTFQVMVANILEKPNASPNTLFIEPPGMSRYRIFQWSKRKEIFDLGKAYAEKLLGQ